MVKYSHGDDVSLLLGDVVVIVGILADDPVQAAVGHLRVARAGEVHGQHLGVRGTLLSDIIMIVVLQLTLNLRKLFLQNEIMMISNKYGLIVQTDITRCEDN